MSFQTRAEAGIHFNWVVGPNAEASKDEFEISLKEQIRNVKTGICHVELRDSLQGIPDLEYPSVDRIAEILVAAENADIMETTVSIQTRDDSITDKTTRETLLWMRENSLMIPAFAIPATIKGAMIAEDLIVNYHRGLNIKVFMPVADERMKAHGWTIDTVQRQTRDTIAYLTSRYPNKVTAVIEQASQATDENLFNMVDMAAQANASGVCLADTLSFFDEEQAFSFILKVRKHINNQVIACEEAGDFALADRYNALRLEYHGHNDFNLASRAARGALRAGAVPHVVPGDPAGIGERAGNASLGDTYRLCNEYLVEHGEEPVMPTDKVAELDAVFIEATYADPSAYGPEGANADVTCAALHADYILKIWNKLQYAKEQLELSRKNRDTRMSLIMDQQTGKMKKVQREAIWQKRVDEYTRLYREGYLPRRDDMAVGEHHFRLNAFSNEDTVRMFFHELTGRSPHDISQNMINHILWIIKDQNRPLTPMEIQHYFQTDNIPDQEYPWDRITSTHPNYQPEYLEPKAGRVRRKEPAEPIKWQRHRV